MSNNSPLKMVGLIILGIIAIFFGIKVIGALAVGLLSLILKLAIPALIVGGVLYAIYRISGADKSLPGSHKRLP